MTFKSATLAGLFSAALVATAHPAQALTIDNFDCNDTSASATSGSVSTSTLNNTCVVGTGDRELELSGITGSIGGDEAEVKVAGGLLSLNQDGAVDSTLTVTWDDFGLQNLTAGGATMFGVMLTYVDQWLNMTMRVVDGSANVSTMTLNNIEEGLHVLPFASFIGGANFSNIASIQMIIDGPTGLDAKFDSVTTSSPVPEPATFMLLGLGLLGVGAKRVLRKA